MDIVSLRPEMELCYLAIVNKCFEILEGSRDDDTTARVHDSSTAPGNPGRDDTNSSDEDSNDEDEDDNDDANDDNTAGDSPGDDSDLDSEAESTDLSEEDLAGLDGQAKPPRLKLREILFYDVRVSIFKARHGKL